MSRERMLHHRAVTRSLIAILAGAGALSAVELQSQNTPLVVTVGKSLVLDNAMNIQRISLANGDLAEAVAVNPREVLINGKMAGETSLVIWQQGGPRLLFDLTVRPSNSRLDNVRGQLARELPGQDVSVYLEGDTVFLHGTAKDMVSADRAAAIAATLGKVVNLLHVVTPAEEPQILLKVRFADVDRSCQLAARLQTSSARALPIPSAQSPRSSFRPQTCWFPVPARRSTATISNALNLFLYRSDLNLGATIEALEAKNLLQMLAEPNVLAMNGKAASFISGGEFPVPVVQGGANVGAVTIQFREFGVKLNFLPTITPRGTIRLQVAPEVSSLDYSQWSRAEWIHSSGARHAQGADRDRAGERPELRHRRIAGQHASTRPSTRFRASGDIPLLGKLFQSRMLPRAIGAADHGDAGTGAAHSGRTAAAGRAHDQAVPEGHAEGSAAQSRESMSPDRCR